MEEEIKAISPSSERMKYLEEHLNAIVLLVQNLEQENRNLREKNQDLQNAIDEEEEYRYEQMIMDDEY